MHLQSQILAKSHQLTIGLKGKPNAFYTNGFITVVSP